MINYLYKKVGTSLQLLNTVGTLHKNLNHFYTGKLFSEK